MTVFYKGLGGIEESGGQFFGLKSGESAVLWFLIDQDEVLQFAEHTGITDPADGKMKMLTCPESVPDGFECALCKSGDKPVKRLAAPVYVLKKNKEEVNEVQLLKLGVKFWRLMKEFADEYGTICDRPYKISRKGEGFNTTWTPIGLDKGTRPEADNIPDINTVYAPKERAEYVRLAGVMKEQKQAQENDPEPY